NCCAWGGTVPLTLDGATRDWPATWMPWYGDAVQFGWNDHGILAHEMSHAFGASHSKSPVGDEYGNGFDVVSMPCGTGLAKDPKLGCVGQHQIAFNKMAMG